MIDSYYTDSSLADNLISYIPDNIPIASVADFCAGGGELLNATIRRYPTVECTAVDIDATAINTITKEHPNWNIVHADFMNRSEMDASIGDLRYDLITLNPPFSCKGSKIVSVQIDGYSFKVSTSMAFLLQAIEYLKPEGILVTILPMSIVYSQKDKLAWQFLQHNYNAYVLQELDKYPFNKCAPGIVLVSINYEFDKTYTSTSIAHCDCDFPFEIHIKRGQLSMCDVSKNEDGDLLLIHTTNLCDNKIANLNTKVNTHSTVCGPAVLIPRVCNPNVGKIVLLEEKRKYAISDCIIALMVDNIIDATQLYDTIKNDWESFRGLYKGTGAKYITLERLKEYLNYTQRV